MFLFVNLIISKMETCARVAFVSGIFQVA